MLLLFSYLVEYFRRIREYPELERTHKDHQSPAPGPVEDTTGIHNVPESIVHTLLELCQTWDCDHFPEEFVPIPAG